MSPYSNTIPQRGESDFDRANRLELEAINANIQQQQQQQQQGGAASVPRMHHRSHSRNATAYQQQQEQFLRSASARLARSNKQDDEIVSAAAASGAAGTPNNRDGERKREESMKRLLEWKQRMLQSPLTRKGMPISMAMEAAAIKSPSVSQMMLMAGGGSAGRDGGGGGGVNSGTGVQRSRSESYAPGGAGYNSYSSDDEGICFYNFCVAVCLVV